MGGNRYIFRRPLKPCLFNKVITVSSLTGLPSHRFLSRLTGLSMSSFLWATPSIQSEVGWFTVMPPLHQRTYLARLVVTVCTVAGSELVKTIDDFYSPQTCTTPSRTMRACHYGRRCQVNISLISQCLMTKVCSVFNDRVFISSSSRQPKAMVINCIVLWVSGIPLINISVENILYLPLSF